MSKNLSMDCDGVICGSLFETQAICDFICPACRSALKCVCGSDAVTMDWDVIPKDDGSFPPYQWSIECECGKSAQSPECYFDTMDAEASALYKLWIAVTVHTCDWNTKSPDFDGSNGCAACTASVFGVALSVVK